MNVRYVGLRLLQVVPTVAGILLVAFLLIHLAPGDPVLALAGEHGDAAYYAFIRERFGLDEPLHLQLITYVTRVLQGDLGMSYVQGRPTVHVIAERLPATLLLTVSALVVSTLVGIVLGLYAASQHRRPGDAAVNISTLALYAAPVFWLGQLAILLFAYGAGWFPIQGIRTPASAASSGLAAFGDVMHHLALPTLVLATQEIAAIGRLTRVGVLDELRSVHVRAARAKGISAARVLQRHALRPALLPVVTVIGARLGHIVSGAVIVEIVFGWPGVGRLLVTAIQTRDGPVLLGIFLLVAFAVAIANLATDLTYARLDPRVRLR